MLKSPNATQRARGAELLRRHRDLGDEHVAALKLALQDEKYAVRMRAAGSLGEIGLGTPDVVDSLITALGDTHGKVRECAQRALVTIGEPSVPALVTAVRDNPKVRDLASEVLGQIGTPAVVNLLLPLLNHDCAGVRCCAAFAVGKIKALETRPAVILRLGKLAQNDASSDVRYYATQALQTIDSGKEAAVGKMLANK